MKQTFRGAVLMKNTIVQCHYALYRGYFCKEKLLLSQIIGSCKNHLSILSIQEKFLSNSLGFDL